VFPFDDHDRQPSSQTSALAFIAVFLLIAYKSPDALTHSQFWAEDGRIFFQQQFGRLIPPLFASYNGYLHVIPRLTAWISAAFPYKSQPFAFNLLAIVIGSASVFHFAKRSEILAPFWVTVAIFILAPTTGEEFGSIANAHWLTQFSLFAASLYPKQLHINTDNNTKKVLKKCLYWSAIICMSLSGPFSIFCALLGAALFACNALHLRFGKHNALIEHAGDLWRSLDKETFCLVAMCGLIQTATLLFVGTRPTGSFSTQIALDLLTKGLQLHVLGTEVLPRGLFLTIAATIIALTFRQFKARTSVVHVLIIAICAFAILQILGASTPMLEVATESLNGDRYFFFAKVGFWISFSALLGAAPSESKIPKAYWVPFLLACLHLSIPGNIQRPQLADLNWKEGARQLNSQEKTVRIPINPKPWLITINRP
jgi:hypothetical protein